MTMTLKLTTKKPLGPRSTETGSATGGAGGSETDIAGRTGGRNCAGTGTGPETGIGGRTDGGSDGGGKGTGTAGRSGGGSGSAGIAWLTGGGSGAAVENTGPAAGAETGITGRTGRDSGLWKR